MSPPLPLPSKAAVRALRSLALGTSCAIGAIVEDRRRRISTLQTAVSNKKKLQTSRKYHNGGFEQIEHMSWLVDDATLGTTNMQWHEAEDCGPRQHCNDDLNEPEYDIFDNIENQDPFRSGLSQVHEKLPQLLSSRSPLPQPMTPQQSPNISIQGLRTSLASQSPSDSLTSQAADLSQSSPSAELHKPHNALILAAEDLLASKEEDVLDKVVQLFLSNGPEVLLGARRESWLELSLRLFRRCRANGRWQDASQILTTVIESGPLDEAQYFAYDPLPIIQFHIRRPDSNTPCSIERVTSAAKIYLAKLMNKREGRGTHMETTGRLLMIEALSLKRCTLARHIYWRMIGWASSPEICASSAIRTFFGHGDYKTVLKIFLLHYLPMKHGIEFWEPTLDMVVQSVEAMKGSHGRSVLKALAQIEVPEGGKLHSRWIMQMLRADWARHKDMCKMKETFEETVSLGLLDRIGHPEGVYRTLVEIAVKAGDAETAHWYADTVVQDYPNMENDIALKLSVLKAEAGDWEGVRAAFEQVQRSELAEPAAYENAFILVLKVFSKSHSADETRDFSMLFVREIGVKFHPYMVTLVAKKYGDARDMKGFMAWATLCSQEGFALDAGICNSVLYNCSAKWKIPFSELRMIHAKLVALNPHCSDDVTQRIMSQAAQRVGNGFVHTRPGKMITVNKMAYLGRSTNNWDIFEAMNQELMHNKPTAAAIIYKRAIQFGMPFCRHCLRLAVLASLEAKDFGAGHALSLIQGAHAQGHDVGSAVSTFMKRQIDALHGSPEDLVIYMRNLISRFESSNIAISPAVLTHMATVCAKIGQHEKAISLCLLARDRSGSLDLCFSPQSFTALATAYSQLLDVEGMNALVDSMCDGEFSADKALLLHLKSIRRLMKKKDPSDSKTALLEVIERGIEHLTDTRAKARTQGKLISQETLKIIGDALIDMEANETGREGAQSKPRPWAYKGNPGIHTEGLSRRVVTG
ncbi:hypothetical protein F5Y03DRAFT_345676 [Xylaria venustula]|nr:hypothetical protein F5Y03DRAFT_345676 [Xylaria venustula]